MVEDETLPPGTTIAASGEALEANGMTSTEVEAAVEHDHPLRWFALDRQHDVTGMSGTGIIAFALVLEHGVLLFWDTGWQTMSWFPDMETVLDVHGHDGNTVPVRIVAIDRPMKLFHHRIGDVMDTMGDALVALAAATGPRAERIGISDVA